MNQPTGDPVTSSVGAEVPATDDLTIEVFRQSRRRLKVMDRLAALIGFGFILAVMYLMTIARQTDSFYTVPFLFGTFTNLSRIIIYKVKAVPDAVLALLSADPARRAGAGRLIEAHRAEILGATEVAGQRVGEPEVTTWPLEVVAERVQGRVNWRRLAAYWFVVWAGCLVAVVVGLVLYVPEIRRG